MRGAASPRDRSGTSRSRATRSSATSSWPTAAIRRCASSCARRWRSSPTSATAAVSRASSSASTASPPTRRATSTPPRRTRGNGCRSSSTRGCARCGAVKGWFGRRSKPLGRETSMKLSAVTVVGLLAGFAGLVMAQALKGPVSDAPFTEKWWPSKRGADDRAGSANHTRNSANIKRAMATVKQFRSITIGKYYHREAPAFGARGWQLSIPGTPTGGPFGKNAMVYHDELLTAEIGQIGTQFDGPGHIGVNTSKGPMMYNGRLVWDAYERGPGGRVLGMGPLGVEHVGELGFVCRLVVLDAVAYRKKQGRLGAN